MYMRKLYFFAFVAMTMLSCSKQDQYLIAKNQIGELTATTPVTEIENIFSGDSIVVDEDESSELLSSEGIYRIYDNAGKPKLKVVTALVDSVSKVKYVDVLSHEYKTDKGLSLHSKFKDIKKNYTLDKVEVSFSSVVLYLNDVNVTVTLDKKDLGIDAFDLAPVSKDQISESAKVKSLTLWME